MSVCEWWGGRDHYQQENVWYYHSRHWLMFPSEPSWTNDRPDSHWCLIFKIIQTLSSINMQMRRSKTLILWWYDWHAAALSHSRLLWEITSKNNSLNKTANRIFTVQPSPLPTNHYLIAYTSILIRINLITSFEKITERRFFAQWKRAERKWK